MSSLILNTELEEQSTEEVSTEEEIIIDLEALGLGGDQDEIWGPGTLTYFGPKSRVILMAGDVDENMSNSIISQLLELDKQDSCTPITIYINTPGGEVSQALAMLDMMKMVKPKIIIIAIGACMSAGLLLLQGADLRIATPNCRFMYHEPIAEGGAISREGMEAFTENYNWAIDIVNSVIRDRAKIDEETWERLFNGRTGFYFGAEQALELGLIDVIFEYPDKDEEE